MKTYEDMVHPDLLDGFLKMAGFAEMSDEERSAAAKTNPAARPRPANVEVSDELWPRTAGEGPEICVRVYRPTDAPAPMPAMIWIHGGGFTGGSVEVGDAEAAEVASRGVLVVSVDYRLSPAAVFPAALDDSRSVYDALCSDKWRSTVDLNRIGVCGMSSGGAIAAGLALQLRDEGRSLASVLLFEPQLDDRLTTGSAEKYRDTRIWSRSAVEASWAAYFGPSMTPGSPTVPAYAAPSRASELEGFPPTFIWVPEIDPMRDEGIEFARRLVEAGVPVELHLQAGTFHACTLVAADAPLSVKIREDLLRAAVSMLAAPSKR